MRRLDQMSPPITDSNARLFRCAYRLSEMNTIESSAVHQLSDTRKPHCKTCGPDPMRVVFDKNVSFAMRTMCERISLEKRVIRGTLQATQHLPSCNGGEGSRQGGLRRHSLDLDIYKSNHRSEAGAAGDHYGQRMRYITLAHNDASSCILGQDTDYNIRTKSHAPSHHLGLRVRAGHGPR